MATYVLGVFTGHDQSACLLRDGAIAVLIEEERLTRVKHGLPKTVRGLWADFNGRFGYFPWASVAYCLEAAGIGLDDLDALVLPEGGEGAALIPMKDRKKILVHDEPAGSEHHLRHALSAFFASPFERAAVLVIDGDGSVNAQGYEAETGYFFKDRNGKSREVFKNRYPAGGLAHGLRGGLGWTYDYVSAVLGFVNTKIAYLSEPGKTMGLAPYGEPTKELGAPWIGRDGTKLDFSAFHEWLVRSGLSKLVSFEDRDKALVQNEEAIPQVAKDLAWKVQHELEEAVLHLARELHRETGAKDLCLAGGVALNSVANGLIVAKGPFERVFVQPAAADNGQSIGLAYWGHQKLSEKPIAPIKHAFGGRSYEADEVRSLLKAAGLPFKELKDDDSLAREAASDLLASRFIGWFQGGSEYGPRALGHRSILADPRGPGVKDHLNARVKFREPFRPFAPSCMKEKASEVFALPPGVESPYMLLVAPVRDEWRAKVPAITHVDGTARIQTVDREVDPLYHGLISAFAAQAGVPLVLNTSFNLRGMPVVETPRDALQCFLATEMDALYLGRFRVARPEPGRWHPSCAPGWKLVIENELSWGGQSLKARYETLDGKKKAPVKQHPVFFQLCAALDGKKSFGEALAAALEGQRADPEVVQVATQFVQGLVRAGALRIRVGSVEL